MKQSRTQNFGSVHTTGDLFGDFEFFSEGIFAEGDGFYIANHGSVHVEGAFASGLVGVGANGIIINQGNVDSGSFGSTVMAAVGDRSQAINAGLVTARGDDTAALFALGEDASALNVGQITITGTAGTGIAGVVGNTHLTNQGVISITSDESVGISGLGDLHQISNIGLIEVEGTFSRGIISRGLNLEIDNAGRITTAGELAFGITVGLTNTFRTAEDGQIVNSGGIETVGDGAAGVVMIGDRHHLTNSGQISTDGGASDFGGAVGELSAAGVLVSGDDALVENTRSGVITSVNPDSAAVELNVLERDGLSNAATSSTLENSGLIEGAVAILGGDGEETVINHGAHCWRCQSWRGR